MREIKFRAWVNEEDEEYSRMVYSPQAIVTILSHKYGKTGVARPAGFSEIDNQPKPERYVLMQYTGLKDKNGREIYEGDILKEDWTSINGNYDPNIVAVTRDNTGAWRVRYPNKTMANVIGIRNRSEIIGNIYEHPELLRGDKQCHTT